MFDVYGSVWEWCQDFQKPYKSKPKDIVWEDVEDVNLTVSKDFVRPRREGSYTYEAPFIRSGE